MQTWLELQKIALNSNFFLISLIFSKDINLYWRATLWQLNRQGSTQAVPAEWAGTVEMGWQRFVL